MHDARDWPERHETILVREGLLQLAFALLGNVATHLFCELATLLDPNALTCDASACSAIRKSRRHAAFGNSLADDVAEPCCRNVVRYCDEVGSPITIRRKLGSGPQPIFDS